MNRILVRAVVVSALVLLAGCSTISGWFTRHPDTARPPTSSAPGTAAPTRSPGRTSAPQTSQTSTLKPAPEDAMLMIDGRPAPKDAKCKVAVQVMPYTGRDDSPIKVPGYVTFLIDAGKWGDIKNVQVIGSEPGDRYIPIASDAIKNWKFDTEMPDHRHHPMQCRLTMQLDPTARNPAPDDTSDTATK